MNSDRGLGPQQGTSSRSQVLEHPCYAAVLLFSTARRGTLQHLVESSKISCASNVLYSPPTQSIRYTQETALLRKETIFLRGLAQHSETWPQDLSQIQELFTVTTGMYRALSKRPDLLERAMINGHLIDQTEGVVRKFAPDGMIDKHNFASLIASATFGYLNKYKPVEFVGQPGDMVKRMLARGEYPSVNYNAVDYTTLEINNKVKTTQDRRSFVADEFELGNFSQFHCLIDIENDAEASAIFSAVNYYLFTLAKREFKIPAGIRQVLASHMRWFIPMIVFGLVLSTYFTKIAIPISHNDAGRLMSFEVMANPLNLILLVTMILTVLNGYTYRVGAERGDKHWTALYFPKGRCNFKSKPVYYRFQDFVLSLLSFREGVNEMLEVPDGTSRFQRFLNWFVDILLVVCMYFKRGSAGADVQVRTYASVLRNTVSGTSLSAKISALRRCFSSDSDDSSVESSHNVGVETEVVRKVDTTLPPAKSVKSALEVDVVETFVSTASTSSSNSPVAVSAQKVDSAMFPNGMVEYDSTGFFEDEFGRVVNKSPREAEPSIAAPVVASVPAAFVACEPTVGFGSNELDVKEVSSEANVVSSAPAVASVQVAPVVFAADSAVDSEVAMSATKERKVTFDLGSEIVLKEPIEPRIVASSEEFTTFVKEVIATTDTDQTSSGSNSSVNSDKIVDCSVTVLVSDDSLINIRRLIDLLRCECMYDQDGYRTNVSRLVSSIYIARRERYLRAFLYACTRQLVERPVDYSSMASQLEDLVDHLPELRHCDLPKVVYNTGDCTYFEKGLYVEHCLSTAVQTLESFEQCVLSEVYQRVGSWNGVTVLLPYTKEVIEAVVEAACQSELVLKSNLQNSSVINIPMPYSEASTHLVLGHVYVDGYFFTENSHLPAELGINDEKVNTVVYAIRRFVTCGEMLDLPTTMVNLGFSKPERPEVNVDGIAVKLDTVIQSVDNLTAHNFDSIEVAISAMSTKFDSVVPVLSDCTKSVSLILQRLDNQSAEIESLKANLVRQQVAVHSAFESLGKDKIQALETLTAQMENKVGEVTALMREINPITPKVKEASNLTGLLDKVREGENFSVTAHEYDDKVVYFMQFTDQTLRFDVLSSPDYVPKRAVDDACSEMHEKCVEESSCEKDLAKRYQCFDGTDLNSALHAAVKSYVKWSPTYTYHYGDDQSKSFGYFGTHCGVKPEVKSEGLPTFFTNMDWSTVQFGANFDGARCVTLSHAHTGLPLWFFVHGNELEDSERNVFEYILGELALNAFISLYEQAYAPVKLPNHVGKTYVIVNTTLSPAFLSFGQFVGIYINHVDGAKERLAEFKEISYIYSNVRDMLEEVCYFSNRTPFYNLEMFLNVQSHFDVDLHKSCSDVKVHARAYKVPTHVVDVTSYLQTQSFIVGGPMCLLYQTPGSVSHSSTSTNDQETEGAQGRNADVVTPPSSVDGVGHDELKVIETEDTGSIGTPSVSSSSSSSDQSGVKSPKRKKKKTVHEDIVALVSSYKVKTVKKSSTRELNVTGVETANVQDTADKKANASISSIPELESVNTDSYQEEVDRSDAYIGAMLEKTQRLNKRNLAREARNKEQMLELNALVQDDESNNVGLVTEETGGGKVESSPFFDPDLASHAKFAATLQDSLVSARMAEVLKSEIDEIARRSISTIVEEPATIEETVYLQAAADAETDFLSLKDGKEVVLSADDSIIETTNLDDVPVTIIDSALLALQREEFELKLENKKLELTLANIRPDICKTETVETEEVKLDLDSCVLKDTVSNEGEKQRAFELGVELEIALDKRNNGKAVSENVSDAKFEKETLQRTEKVVSEVVFDQKVGDGDKGVLNTDISKTTVAVQPSVHQLYVEKRALEVKEFPENEECSEQLKFLKKRKEELAETIRQRKKIAQEASKANKAKEEESAKLRSTSYAGKAAAAKDLAIDIPKQIVTVSGSNATAHGSSSSVGSDLGAANSLFLRESEKGRLKIKETEKEDCSNSDSASGEWQLQQKKKRAKKHPKISRCGDDFSQPNINNMFDYGAGNDTARTASDDALKRIAMNIRGPDQNEMQFEVIVLNDRSCEMLKRLEKVYSDMKKALPNFVPLTDMPYSCAKRTVGVRALSNVSTILASVCSESDHKVLKTIFLAKRRWARVIVFSTGNFYPFYCPGYEVMRFRTNKQGERIDVFMRKDTAGGDLVEKWAYQCAKVGIECTGLRSVIHVMRQVVPCSRYGHVSEYDILDFRAGKTPYQHCIPGFSPFMWDGQSVRMEGTNVQPSGLEVMFEAYDDFCAFVKSGISDGLSYLDSYGHVKPEAHVDFLKSPKYNFKYFGDRKPLTDVILIDEDECRVIGHFVTGHEKHEELCEDYIPSASLDTIILAVKRGEDLCYYRLVRDDPDYWATSDIVSFNVIYMPRKLVPPFLGFTRNGTLVKLRSGDGDSRGVDKPDRFTGEVRGGTGNNGTVNLPPENGGKTEGGTAQTGTKLPAAGSSKQAAKAPKPKVGAPVVNLPLPKYGEGEVFKAEDFTAFEKVSFKGFSPYVRVQEPTNEAMKSFTYIDERCPNRRKRFNVEYISIGDLKHFLHSRVVPKTHQQRLNREHPEFEVSANVVRPDKVGFLPLLGKQAYFIPGYTSVSSQEAFAACGFDIDATDPQTLAPLQRYGNVLSVKEDKFRANEVFTLKCRTENGNSVFAGNVIVYDAGQDRIEPDELVFVGPKTVSRISHDGKITNIF